MSSTILWTLTYFFGQMECADCKWKIFFLFVKATGAATSFQSRSKWDHIFVFRDSDGYHTGFTPWFQFSLQTLKTEVASKPYSHQLLKRFGQKDILNTTYSGFFSLQVGLTYPRPRRIAVCEHRTVRCPLPEPESQFLRRWPEPARLIGSPEKTGPSILFLDLRQSRGEGPAW